MMIRALLFSLSVSFLGCSSCEPEPEPENPGERPAFEEPLEPSNAAHYFPLQVGDRYRVESSEGARLFGVTAVDGDGLRVVHGTHHATSERYQVTLEAVDLVNPDGELIAPLLRSPLRVGEPVDYSLDQHGTEVSCQVEVSRIGMTLNVGATELTDCLETERVCVYPAGAPFSSETTNTVTEVYCAGVGRVRSDSRFIPPQEGALSDLTETVTGYQVAGAPVFRAEEFDCRSFLVLPSDARAACGRDFVWVPGGPLTPGRCDVGFRLPEGENQGLVFTASVLTSEPSSSEALFSTQSHEVKAETNPEVCPEAALSRFEPLLRSLLPPTLAPTDPADPSLD